MGVIWIDPQKQGLNAFRAAQELYKVCTMHLNEDSSCYYFLLKSFKSKFLPVGRIHAPPPGCRVCRLCRVCILFRRGGSPGTLKFGVKRHPMHPSTTSLPPSDTMQSLQTWSSVRTFSEMGSGQISRNRPQTTPPQHPPASLPLPAATM